MADKIVGRAYVVVRAITKGLDREISTAVNSALNKTGPVVDKEATNLGSRVGDKIGDAAGKKVGAKVAAGVKKATTPTVDASDALGQAAGDAMSKGLVFRALRGVTGLGSKISAKIQPDKEGQTIGQRIGDGIGKGLKKIKLPFLAWAGLLAVPALGAAVQAVGAYLAAATSFIAALGPAIAGAGAAALGSIAALGSGVAGLMIALKAETPVLEAYKASLEPLAALWLQSATAIQTAVLPSMLAARRTITALFPTLEAGLSKTGAATAGVIANLARVVTSSENMARLRDIFSESAHTVSIFGGATGSLATTFLILTRAAAPLTRQFAEWVRGLAGGVEESARAGEASGRLASFLERAGTVSSQLGRIFRGTFEGLKSVLQAAAPAGQLLLNNLESLTDRFAAFTASSEGQNRLREYFSNAVPIVSAINGLIGDLFQMLGRGFEGDSSGLLSFISVLRERLLPTLETLLSTVGQGLGPAMLQLAETFARVLQTLSDSGALGTFVATLSLALKVVSAILDIPVVGTLAAWSLGFLGVVSALNLLTKGLASKAIGSGFKTLVGQLVTTTVTANGTKVALSGLGKSFGLVGLAIGAVAATFTFMDKLDEMSGKLPEVDKLTAAFKRLGETGESVGELDDSFGGVELSDGINKITVPALDTLALKLGESREGWLASMKTFGTFDEVERADAALAKLVETGEGAAAQDAFDQIARAAEKFQIPVSQLIQNLPEYAAAAKLAGIETGHWRQELLDAADAARFKIPPETSAGLRTTQAAAGDLSSELEGVGADFSGVGKSALVSAAEQEQAADQAAEAVEGQVDQVHDLIDAYNELNDMNRSVFETQADAEKATDDLTSTFAELAGLVDANGEVIDTQNLSLSEFLGTYKNLGIALNETSTGFDDNTDAGREAQAAIVAYAEAHDEAAEAVYNQALASATSEAQVRAAGDAYVATQAATRQSIADTLVSIGFEKEAADKMALSLLGIPKVKTTKMLLDDKEAKEKVDAHKARLDQLEIARVSKLDAIEEPGKSKVEAQQARLDHLHDTYESRLAVEDQDARTKAEQQEQRLDLLETPRNTVLDADPNPAIAGVAAAQAAIDGLHGKTVFMDLEWREVHLPQGTGADFGDAGRSVGSRIAQGLGVPMMAEGGILNRPTLLVGGESGREAIAPLDDLAGIMRQMLDLDRGARGGEAPVQIYLGDTFNPVASPTADSNLRQLQRAVVFGLRGRARSDFVVLRKDKVR